MKKYGKVSTRKKIALAAICVGLVLLTGFVVGIFVYFATGFGTDSGGVSGILARGFIRWTGLRFTLFISAGLIAAVMYAALKKDKINNINATDENGVEYLERGTFGTARWLSTEKARKVFEVSDTADGVYGFIFGRTRDTGEVVAYRTPEDGSGNKNVVCIGMSGSGKSASIVGPEIMQAIKRNDSVVVTDPKTELYTLYSSYLRQCGYDVRILNCSDPDMSDGWDCLKEVLSPATGRLDSKRLKRFVSVYLKNTNPDERPDFWTEGANNILQCIIAASAYRREEWLKEAFLRGARAAYEKDGREGRYKDRFEEIKIPVERKNYSLLRIEDFFRRAMAESGYMPDRTELVIREIYKMAPEFTIGSVFRDITLLMKEGGYKTFEASVRDIPAGHVANITYNAFAGDPTATERVKGDTVRGVSYKLDALSSEHLRTMLSNPGITLSDINRKKCAYFVIPPETGNEMKPVLATFFEFLFGDAQATWDETDSWCHEHGTDTLSVLRPVSFVLDEFYSLGTIPIFPEFISKCRGRRLNIAMFLQGLDMLYKNYGEEDGNNILACCNTLLFMGCGKDPVTADYISTYITGIASVAAQSRREGSSLFTVLRPDEVNISENSRALMNRDEVTKYGGGVIVQTGGEQPMELKRFYYREHRMARALRETSLKSSVLPISEKFPDGDIFYRGDGDDNATRLSRVVNLVRNEYAARYAFRKQGDEDGEEELLYWDGPEPEPVRAEGTEKAPETKKAEEPLKKEENINPQPGRKAGRKKHWDNSDIFR